MRVMIWLGMSMIMATVVCGAAAATVTVTAQCVKEKAVTKELLELLKEYPKVMAKAVTDCNEMFTGEKQRECFQGMQRIFDNNAKGVDEAISNLQTLLMNSVCGRSN